VGTFGKGRLSSNTSGQAVAYSYDRFGRLIQDGALGYGYDANGNRTRLTYPNNVAAVYTHDFADREATLTYEQSGGAQPPVIVSSSAYEPFGPLTSLSLGNGLTETRLFDARYFPDRIQVPGRLDWNYTLDAVGNPLQIADLLTPAQSRTYAYQDYQYFLTQGNGPWGTRSWTYDRIGNRLTETRGGVTDTYGYTGGNPKLQTITLGGGAGTKYYAYDGAGNQVQDSRPNSELQLGYDAAGRLSRLEEATTETESFLLYDGRGFLREAQQDLDLCSPMVTQATYSTEGVLVHRAHRNALTPAASPLDEAYVFYLAGRPVAILEGIVPATLTRKYLTSTSDHLGTPVLATSGAAVTLWVGGFEPFGKDWGGAQGVGMFLRFPGQWVDEGWEGASLSSGLYYNVHRWYTQAFGKYDTHDLLTWKSLPHPYLYALANPLLYSDPLGLEPVYNDSNQPIPYKPEVGPPGRVWLCLPGEICNADGVYPSACNDFPIKIVNGCEAEVEMSGRLVVRCPYIDLSARSLREVFSAAGQMVKGGRTNASFHEAHKDWRIPNGKLYCGCDPAHPFSGPPPEVPQMYLP
jgi:RHS repeat-associated protein